MPSKKLGAFRIEAELGAEELFGLGQPWCAGYPKRVGQHVTRSNGPLEIRAVAYAGVMATHGDRELFWQAPSGKQLSTQGRMIES